MSARIMRLDVADEQIFKIGPNEQKKLVLLLSNVLLTCMRPDTFHGDSFE